jgi:dihydropteroate synthase
MQPSSTTAAAVPAAPAPAAGFRAPSPDAVIARAVSSDEDRRALDERLSQRHIALDPAGDFLISLDRERGELVAEHYGNGINDKGLATDPDTGEVLSCRGGGPRRPLAVYRGRTAKELGMRITEETAPAPVSRLDHALYLGRELQKAEAALCAGHTYIQD